jgi:transglutaminase-like putative cysteine protease
MSLRDRLSFAFASLRASVGLVTDFYGESLPLGLGTPLGEQVLMEIEAPSAPPQGVRYYWRARVYSVFEDDQWRVGLDDQREFLPSGRDLAQPGVDARSTAIFTVFPHDPISILYVAPQPLWVSRPSDLMMQTNEDGTIDLESIRAKDYIRPGEQYEMRSSLAAVTIKDLRMAGSEYPQWVLNRYLQIPHDFSPRIQELAQQLAQGLDTPYDITMAITNYLRENITYQPTIDAPEARVDRLEWVLFDYQRGFCYYYATAEVMMLRSVGIPARLAGGFALGDRLVPIFNASEEGPGGPPGPDTDLGETVTYVVRQKYAHAWPEVFFPGIGWVEFEPTTNQDPLFRPSGEDRTGEFTQLDQSGIDLNDLLADQRREQQADQESLDNQHNSVLEFWTTARIIQFAGLLLAVILLILVIWQSRRGRKISPMLTSILEQIPIRLERSLRRLGIQPPGFIIQWANIARLTPLPRAYLEVNRALRRLGRKPGIQDTPAERVQKLVKILPPAYEPAVILLNEYQTEIYSSRRADIEVARDASGKVRKLSYLALIKTVLSRFQEPVDRT